MKNKSDIAREPASLWIRRKEAFDRLAEPILAARKKYRDAISMKVGATGPWGRGDSDSSMVGNVNFSYRFLRWFTAQAMGERPVIRSSRDSSPDEIDGEMVDILLGRVLDEGNALHEWRQTIADKCWLGSSVVWYGYHALVVDAEDVADASEGPGEATERALSGDTAPRPGQDHALMADALRAPTRDPEAGTQLGLSGRAALTEAAQAHDRAAAEEARRAKDPRVLDRRIWFKRGVWGEDSAFDPAACDPSDWEWVMQTVTMRVEEAHKLGTLRPAARKRLKGNVIAPEGSENRANLKTNTVGIQGVDDEDKRVTLHIFWDKRFRTRHIISPELPDEYLENDEANPYTDDDGGPLIPGFFPCGVSVPDLPAIAGAERCFGTPLIAAGWEAERDADKFTYMMVSDADKLSRRDVVIHPNVTNAEELVDALRGPSPAMLRPKGISPDEIERVVVGVKYPTSSGELERQYGAAEARWVKAMGMPQAELSSQPQADTATQEQMGVAAGRNEAEDVVKQDERAFAQMLEGVRGLVRGLYTDEKVMALLGPKYADKYELWKSSTLDGDLLDVKFGTRVHREEAVRIKQTMTFLELAAQYTGPMGLPIWDMRPIYEELAQMLGMGKPQEVAPEAMQARQLMQHLVQENEMLKQQVAEAHAEGKREAQQKQAGAGKPGPKDKNKSQDKAPKADTLNSGARRGTSTG